MTAPSTAPGRVGELRIVAESGTPPVAIATPSSYWASGFKHLRAWDVQPDQLKYDSIDNEALTLNAFEDRQKLLTSKSGGIPFKTHLRGLAQTATNALAVTREDLGLLFVSAMGGESLGTTTTIGVASGAGATASLVVTSSAGMLAGQAVCVNGECRRIVSIADSTHLLLDCDLTTTPANADLCIASATYFISEVGLTDLSNALHVTLAALFRGYGSTDQYQARGCFPEIASFNDLMPGKVASISGILHALAWEFVTGVAADTTWTPAVPPAQISSGLYLQTQSTVTITAARQHAKNVAIALGLKPQLQESAIGEQGKVGHLVDGGRSTLEFETFFTSAWNTAYEAVTKHYAGYQMGKPTTASGCVFISFPELTIDETPARVGPKDNATMVKVKLHANQFLAGATDAAKSRMSIHFFPHL